jgi:alginate O-acetyltransferase complex protein AlgI
MVFASLIFLYVFLPLNLILYYSSGNAVYRNLILTIFSFVFYAWGEPIWVGLLALTAVIDYLNGRFIEANRGKKIAKIGVICSLVFNIGTLLTFKYSQFIVFNVNHYFGSHFNVPTFALPIGISFYTFQSISYVVDVYTGKVTGQKSLLKFLMFVSLYHQLVAGPIVRYVHIAHEIDKRKFNITDISAGITRFCVGLFKKVCIANIAAYYVQQYLEKYTLGELPNITVAEAWFGILMFTVQIYYDFSGYSDMAIGLGRMFGFHYYENFNYPYIAKSATDFWRRWHISLSTWFRDYIYIPLGGNEKTELRLVVDKKTKTFFLRRWFFAIRNGLRRFAYKFLGAKNWKSYRNLFIVWLLTGLWHGGAHGACWNYILWGLFWGTLIFIERSFIGKLLKKIPNLFSGNYFLSLTIKIIHGILAHIYLLSAVILGWIFFYFTDIPHLKSIFGILFGQSGHELNSIEFKIIFKENIFWMALVLIFCMPVYKWIHRFIKHALVRLNKKTLDGENEYLNKLKLVTLWGYNYGITYLLLFIATTMLVGKSYNPFIYYRF